MSTIDDSLDPPAVDVTAQELLQGWRIALVGKLAGMPRREIQPLVRRHGGVVVEQTDPAVNVVVVGEADLPLAVVAVEESFDDSLRHAIEQGSVEVLSETQLWQRLGFVEPDQNIRRLYTPAMLAELVGVPIAVIRRWHRRGLIVPVREVRRLAYFDFQEVATARRLAELLSAGVSAAAIEKKLAALARFLPGVERPLNQLSIIVEGQHLLLRQGDGLLEPGGQLRIDFCERHPDDRAAVKVPRPEDLVSRGPAATSLEIPKTPPEMIKLAGELEDQGQLDLAADMYRTALVAGGPSPEICFLLAEVLYQLGDLGASRERYYMAIELDEDYVEARANLGCVLAETSQLELAIAAFEGALAYHEDYADVHYHLARALDAVDRCAEAGVHWEAFLKLASDSPWADEARERLGLPT